MSATIIALAKLIASVLSAGLLYRGFSPAQHGALLTKIAGIIVAACTVVAVIPDVINFFKSDEASQTEQTFWVGVLKYREEHKNNQMDCEYLKKYPEGQFIVLAKAECPDQVTEEAAAPVEPIAPDAAAPAPAIDDVAPVAEVSTDPNCVGDCVNGYGTYTFANGEKYEGEWKDDKFNGQGTYIYANGDKYVGEHKDGKANGQGTHTFGEKSQFAGDIYVGEFKDDKFNGQGTYAFANGNKYVGEFKEGKFNGQGTATFADGKKYEGEWKDDNRNGQGTYTFADGRVQSGFWVDDKFMGAK